MFAGGSNCVPNMYGVDTCILGNCQARILPFVQMSDLIQLLNMPATHGVLIPLDSLFSSTVWQHLGLKLLDLTFSSSAFDIASPTFRTWTWTWQNLNHTGRRFCYLPAVSTRFHTDGQVLNNMYPNIRSRCIGPHCVRRCNGDVRTMAFYNFWRQNWRCTAASDMWHHVRCWLQFNRLRR